jgi:hypothetical protein
MLAGLIGRRPYALDALDTAALHFEDQTALGMQKDEIRLHVRARAATGQGPSGNIKRVDEHVVVGQLPAQAIEQSRL